MNNNPNPDLDKARARRGRARTPVVSNDAPKIKNYYKPRAKRPLTTEQQKFVELYCQGSGLREAAILAGFAPQSAHTRAYKLVHNPGAVKDAIAAFKLTQAKVMEEVAHYNTKTAMDELDRGIAFAMETKNATALARFTELKMKMSGLLDKAPDTGAAQFQINIVGLADPVKQLVLEDIL